MNGPAPFEVGVTREWREVLDAIDTALDAFAPPLPVPGVIPIHSRRPRVLFPNSPQLSPRVAMPHGERNAKNDTSGAVRLTVQEAAEKLRLSVDHLYELAREERIPHVREGRRVWFEVDQLEAWNRERTKVLRMVEG